MKKLTIKKLNASAVEASAVPALMNETGIEWNAIACINWQEFPYQPEVKFRAAHNGEALLLHYQVTEASVRAVALADDGRVWEDACVEFFLSPESNDFYYNFECNCATKLLLHYQVTEASVRAVALADDGRVWEDACVEFFLSPEGNDFYYNFECNCATKLLLHGGPAGGERPTASEEVLKSVKRWSSLGTEPFGERVGECTWEVALVIPASAIFRHEITDLNGKTMRANFYKCGDLLQTPHFLSWAPIELPKPKFHCPEFFGELNFE